MLLGNFAYDRKLEANAGVSLASLARHYDFTMNLIKHFRGQLTLRYLPVRYETLVADPSAALRQILDFIGADAAIPDADTLRANRTAAASRVPGHAVTQRSIADQGINIFQKFEAAAPNLLTEIRPILAPWIDALGYTP